MSVTREPPFTFIHEKIFIYRLKGKIQWSSESVHQNGLARIHSIPVKLIEIVSSKATEKAKDPKRTQSEGKKHGS